MVLRRVGVVETEDDGCVIAAPEDNGGERRECGDVHKKADVPQAVSGMQVFQVGFDVSQRWTMGCAALYKYEKRR